MSLFIIGLAAIGLVAAALVSGQLYATPALNISMTCFTFGVTLLGYQAAIGVGATVGAVSIVCGTGLLAGSAGGLWSKPPTQDFLNQTEKLCSTSKQIEKIRAHKP